MAGQNPVRARLRLGGNPYVPPRMRFTYLVRPLVLGLSLVCLIRPAPAQAADLFLRDLDAMVENGLAEERRLYFLKCQSAMVSRERHVRDALIGMAFFLADVPLEYASSRIIHTERRQPASLNAAAFVLMGISLYHLSRSNRHFQDYARDRGACRCWQDYAKLE